MTRQASLVLAALMEQRSLSAHKTRLLRPKDCLGVCDEAFCIGIILTRRTEYTWTIPFDMQGLIEQMGGIEATERRLDLMFVPKLRTVDLGVGVASGTTLFNPGRHGA